MTRKTTDKTRGTTIAPTWYPTLSSEACERLRTRLFLRAVLPLLPIIVRDHAPTTRRLGQLSATVRLAIRTSDMGATLRFRAGQLHVEDRPLAPGEHAHVRCEFASHQALNRFFAGQAALPRVAGWRHPMVLARLARLLWELRILQPEHIPTNPDDRRLRARLILTLIASGLAELYRGGYPAMVELVRTSPDRVYQWQTVEEGIATYLRMHRGQIATGVGICPGRRPFVSYEFRDVDAVMQVLGETDSQMTGLRDGLFRTVGSPEYTRKIAILTQQVDALLMPA